VLVMPRWNAVAAAVMLTVASGASGAPAAQQPGAPIQLKTVPITHYRFSEVDRDAHFWSALYIASNGKIFVGLCTHADAATVHEFDPRTQRMRQLANITVLAGERGLGIWTTGKIHVQMQELDGWVYFGTLSEDNGPPAIDAASYRGPHWYRVNIETGQVEQRGLINSFWGLLGQAMDKRRRIIYGLAENGHLYRYFIDQDRTEDMGRVDDWDICRTIVIDDDGNVYGSYAPGMVWKYDVQQDRIIDFERVQLPIVNQSRTMANPMLDRKAQWRIVEWDPVDKAIYGIVGGSNQLFRYDPKAGPEGTFATLAELCPPQFRGGNTMNIPNATLAMTLSQKERRIYYIPVISSDFDYGTVSFDVVDRSKFGGLMGKGNLPPLGFMTSYDLRTGKVEDLGLLKAQDGRYAFGSQAAKTDADGRIWFVGAFEEPNPKLAANPRSKSPYSLGLGCYDPFAATREKK
jgi:hypothetical protein